MKKMNASPTKTRAKITGSRTPVKQPMTKLDKKPLSALKPAESGKKVPCLYYSYSTISGKE